MIQGRGPNLLVTLSFLAIIFGVGLVQAVMEAQRGQWPQVLSVFDRMPTAKALRAYETRLEDSSVAVQRLRPWVQYAQFRFLEDAGDKALAGRDGWMFYRPSVDYVTRRRTSPPDPGGSADPLPAIVSFRDALAARGIRLLIVPAPDKESVYPDKLTRRTESLRAFLAPPTQNLLARLRENDVAVVDLFSAFAAAREDARAADDPLLYLMQDSHWSPAGAEMAARLAARTILDRGWLEPGRTAYAAAPVSLRRVGDVIRMLQVPQIEQWVRPEPVNCRQVVHRTSGETYADDAGSDVLVLGDSFLRVYQTDDPGAAGFIAHLARELGRPVASIVNDGGAATLVRQDLSRRPAILAGKKVVIWAFVERDIAFAMEGW